MLESLVFCFQQGMWSIANLYLSESNIHSLKHPFLRKTEIFISTPAAMYLLEKPQANEFYIFHYHTHRHVQSIKQSTSIRRKAGIRRWRWWSWTRTSTSLSLNLNPKLISIRRRRRYTHSKCLWVIVTMRPHNEGTEEVSQDLGVGRDPKTDSPPPQDGWLVEHLQVKQALVGADFGNIKRDRGFDGERWQRNNWSRYVIQVGNPELKNCCFCSH